LTSGHADHSATTPCWRQAQNYALRTKPGSFKGGNESPHHRIFAAALKQFTFKKLLFARALPLLLCVWLFYSSSLKFKK